MICVESVSIKTQGPSFLRAVLNVYRVGDGSHWPAIATGLSRLPGLSIFNQRALTRQAGTALSVRRSQEGVVL